MNLSTELTYILSGTPLSVSCYSGRFMFGKECLAISGDRDVLFLHLIVTGLAARLGVPRKDDLGKGEVWYWPDLPWDETVEIDEVKAPPVMVELKQVEIPVELQGFQAASSVFVSLQRHMQGDFGCVPVHEAQANRAALASGSGKEIRSEYPWIFDLSKRLVIVTNDVKTTVALI